MRRALVAAVLSALATAAVLATVGFGAANKSSTTKKSSAKGKSSQTTTATKPPPTMKEALAAEEKLRAANQEKLAKSLGVSVDKLQSALDAVKKKNLDQAVKDNRLTAEQRDAILACDKAPLTCDRSNLPAYGFHGGPGHFGGPGGPVPVPGGPGLRHFRGGPAGSDTFVKDLAAELGISRRDGASCRLARPCPVGPLALGQRPVGQNVVAAPAQLGHERLGDAGQLVCRDGDPHRASLAGSAPAAACWHSRPGVSSPWWTRSRSSQT